MTSPSVTQLPICKIPRINYYCSFGFLMTCLLFTQQQIIIFLIIYFNKYENVDLQLSVHIMKLGIP
jgi:hypothetical protein